MTLTNSQIYQEGTYWRTVEGIYLYEAWDQSSLTATIKGCVIKDCATGVYTYANPTLYMDSCEVRDNGTRGFLLQSYYSQSRMLGHVRFCNITNNGTWAVYCNYDGYTSPGLAIDFKNNWWGGSDGYSVEAKVYDYSDDANMTLVEYVPFLNGPYQTGSIITAGYLQGYYNDTTLASSASPYKVLGRVIVPAPKHLTIAAGCQFYCSPHSGFNIDGRLTADGDSLNPIIFTSAADSTGGSPTHGAWEGLDFTANSDNALCLLDWCEVRYAVDGVYLTENRDFAPLQMSNCTISHSSDRGIEISNSSPVIDRCVIKNFANDGVYVTGNNSNVTLTNSQIYQEGTYWRTVEGVYLNQNLTATISGCVIKDCNTGVYTYADPTLYMTNCEIKLNTNSDIYVYCVNSERMLGSIHYCNIYNNAGAGAYGIRCARTGSGAGGLTIDATNNWWRYPDSTIVENNFVWDYKDDVNLPRVQFMPIQGTLNRQPCPSDFNFSGRTDYSDLAMLGSSFGSRPGYLNWLNICNISRVGSSDLRIDGLDLALFGSQYGIEGGCSPFAKLEILKLPSESLEVTVTFAVEGEFLIAGVQPRVPEPYRTIGLALDWIVDSSLVSMDHLRQSVSSANELGISVLYSIQPQRTVFSAVSLRNETLDNQLLGKLLCTRLDLEEAMPNQAFKIENVSLVLDNYQVVLNPHVTLELQSSNPVPREFRVDQNYPNPFNQSTRIAYSLNLRSNVRITIYNVLGQTVRNQSYELQGPGEFQYDWDGTDSRGHIVASGIYFYRVQTPSKSETRKMLLMK